jgi:hypothetical protein
VNIREVLRRINFKIGNLDNIQGKAINNIMPYRYIVDELNSQLRQYANITKAIQDVYSFPLESNMPFVKAPELALRSKGYKYIYVISRGTIFPCDIRNQRDVYPIFRYSPINGITNWIMPWNEGKNQFLALFPTNNVARQLKKLTTSISKDDTTIYLDSTDGLIARNGRVTIGDEKIVYEQATSAVLYGCVRGAEDTEAVNHIQGEDVRENNVVVFYSRLPKSIIVHDDNIVPEDILNRELEIIEEHLEGIIKATAYNLLVKLDPERAGIYKIDFDALYVQYKDDISKGYSRIRQGTNIRMPFDMNEGGVPYGANFFGF